MKKTLSELGEIRLISKVQKIFSLKDPQVLCGIGDDCAVVEVGKKKLLFTTDALLENIHFDWKWTDPFLLGRKALSVNLSDIAAMGGWPRWALLSVAFPRTESAKKVLRFYQGFRDCAKRFSVDLIGGDTDQSLEGWKITVTLIGEVRKPLFRAGAQPGDLIYVTGNPGFSSLGLECLKRGVNTWDARLFIEAHQNPVPRLRIGQRLAEKQYATSMIDTSDGILLDLHRICESSKLGAKLYRDAILLSEDFRKTAWSLKLDPVNLFLSGGEDYELLFTSPPHLRPRLELLFKKLESRLTILGEIKKGKKIILHAPAFRPSSKGFEHFKI